MPRFRFRLSGRRFEFGVEPLLGACALACAALLMVWFVDALHVSIERGERLRGEQQSAANADAPRPTPQNNLRTLVLSPTAK